MRVDSLLKQPGCWLSSRRTRSHGIAVSCRVRVARNLQKFRFPDWSDARVRCELLEWLAEIVSSTDQMEAPTFLRTNTLSDVDRLVLQERHLISRELAQRDAGGGVIFSKDERLSVMINEEDHLRIQATRPGMNLRSLWQMVDALDSAIESKVEYAFSPKLGYLTACPSNVGTGLRASVMLHLLGLRLSNEIDQVLKALERLELAVRGIAGEGSDAAGFLFQVSNQETLGRSETEIIRSLEQVVSELVTQEHQARLRVMERSPRLVEDCVARAYAILASSRVLLSHETIDYLCALRMGLELGMVKGLTVGAINRMILASQAGHLQKRANGEMDADARDRTRSDLLKKWMQKVTLHF